MSSHRSTFFAGTVFGIVIGLPIGHLTLWSSATSTESVTKVFEQTSETEGVVPFELGAQASYSPFFPDSSAGIVRLAPQPDAAPSLTDELEEVTEAEIQITPDSPLANAIAIRTVEMDSEEDGRDPMAADLRFTVDEPEQLQLPNAIPLTTNDESEDLATAQTDQRLRIVIDQEIPEVPKAQREIWYESLREMSLEDATGVLRMWKMIGGPVPGLPNSLLDTDIPNAPEFESLQPDTSHESTAMDSIIESAISIHEQNVVMSSMLGYRRVVPRFIEENQDGRAVITGIAPEFDFTSAGAISSGNPLDLRIDGPGMFLVVDTDGNRFLTRRGRFSLNKERKLALVDPGAEYVLQPEIEIPSNVEQIMIDQGGQVSIIETNNPTPTQLGSIHICPILQPHLLEYHKNGLLRCQADGVDLNPILPDRVGVGRIQQGKVEVSNVLPEREVEQIQRLRFEPNSTKAE